MSHYVLLGVNNLSHGCPPIITVKASSLEAAAAKLGGMLLRHDYGEGQILRAATYFNGNPDSGIFEPGDCTIEAIASAEKMPWCVKGINQMIPITGDRLRQRMADLRRDLELVYVQGLRLGPTLALD